MLSQKVSGSKQASTYVWLSSFNGGIHKRFLLMDLFLLMPSETIKNPALKAGGYGYGLFGIRLAAVRENSRLPTQAHQ